MPVSLDQFKQQVVKSSLMSAADLRAAVASVGADQPRDAQQLARLLVEQKKLTAYQAQQIYAGKGKSLVLGNYVVLDKLGQGGMGMVLKAEHRRMKRIVALKVLSPAVTKSPERRGGSSGKWKRRPSWNMRTSSPLMMRTKRTARTSW